MLPTSADDFGAEVVRTNVGANIVRPPAPQLNRKTLFSRVGEDSILPKKV